LVREWGRDVSFDQHETDRLGSGSLEHPAVDVEG
jgi:hypothetical protein